MENLNLNLLIGSTIIFIAYAAFYWKHKTKSLSMTVYVKDKDGKVREWRGWLFTLFMFATALPFAIDETGHIVVLWNYELAMYPIACLMLMWAGFSRAFKEKYIKQIHHTTSTVAITTGFAGLWSLWALLTFLVSLGLIRYMPKKKINRKTDNSSVFSIYSFTGYRHPSSIDLKKYEPLFPRERFLLYLEIAAFLIIQGFRLEKML